MQTGKFTRSHPVSGAGLGLRRSLLDQLAKPEIADKTSAISFLEVAPENWIDMGGNLARKFSYYTERYPIVAHGLSLSLGSPAPLDEVLVKRVAKFMRQHNIKFYSDHLSFCSDDGHLYDLLPIPFTEAAMNHVAERIMRVQDIIGERIGVENASYYAPLASEVPEIEFINGIIEKADCQIILDVNNIYVNSVNHSFDPVSFLEQMPGDRIAYAHIAGHMNEAEDLVVDTHGATVIDKVWDLLGVAYNTFGVFPTLLERDFNIPPAEELLLEVDKIAEMQAKHDHNILATATQS